MTEQLSLTDVLEAFMYRYYESCLEGVDPVKQYLSPTCKMTIKTSSLSGPKEVESETLVGPESISARLKEILSSVARAEIVSWTPMPREDVCTLVVSVLWRREAEGDGGEGNEGGEKEKSAAGAGAGAKTAEAKTEGDPAGSDAKRGEGLGEGVVMETTDVFTLEVVPQGRGRRVFSVVSIVSHIVTQE